MAKEAGYIPKRMKYLVKKEILGLETWKDNKGNYHQQEYKSSDLSIKEMSDLISETVQKAGEYYGLNVESPARFGYEWELKKGEVR